MIKRKPMIYFTYATIVLLVNLFGYYIPFIQTNVSMSNFYLFMLPFQLGILGWYLYLVFKDAPLNENISVFLVVYFFLQLPFVLSYGLREVDQLYDFVDMMLMIVIGFSFATVFVLALIDIWPGYVSLTVFALLLLRFLNLSWVKIFNIYDVSSSVIVGTIFYAFLAIGVIFLEAYTLYRFYELEE